MAFILSDQGSIRPDHLTVKETPVVEEDEPSPEKIKDLKDKQIASDKFFKKLMILSTTREFKSRDKNFFKHEYSDKLVVMDKVERSLH